MDNSKKPLCVILEEARAEYVRAFNEATAKTRLPAYLCENILLGILGTFGHKRRLRLPPK